MSGMPEPSHDTEPDTLDEAAREGRGDLCYYNEPHHWSSHHMPRCPIWVKICTQCRAIDGDDLNAQIAHIAVKAADNDRRETELKADRDYIRDEAKRQLQSRDDQIRRLGVMLLALTKPVGGEHCCGGVGNAWGHTPFCANTPPFPHPDDWIEVPA